MSLQSFTSILEGSQPYPWREIGLNQEFAAIDGTTAFQWPKSDYWTTDVNGSPSTFSVQPAGQDPAKTIRAWPNRVELISGTSSQDLRNVVGQEILTENCIVETRLTIEDCSFSTSSAVTIFAFDNKFGADNRGVQFSTSDARDRIIFAPGSTGSQLEWNASVETYQTWASDNGKAKTLIFRVFPKLGLVAAALKEPTNIVVAASLDDVTGAASMNDMTDCSWRIRVKQNSSAVKTMYFTRMYVQNFA